MPERDRAALIASDPRGRVPLRLHEPAFCTVCRTLMRRGTHYVWVDGRPTHASIATCKAATRRVRRRAGGQSG